MVTLRCTQKLLKRIPPAARQAESGDALPADDADKPALGDWFATVLVMRPTHLVLCCSEHSRLAVIMPAREPKLLVPRFQHAVERLLVNLGVAHDAVAKELQLMHRVEIGDTRGVATARSVLGTMNDFSYAIKLNVLELGWRTDEEGLLALGIHLSATPCGPLKMESPYGVALPLLGQTPLPYRERPDIDVYKYRRY